MLFFLNGMTYSQSGWYPIITPDPSLTFLNVKFFNQYTGIASGYSHDNGKGVIYKTTDSGITWQKNIYSPGYFADMFFVNNLTGYVIGTDTGYCVYKTTNGGDNWNRLQCPSGNFFKVSFFDANTGIVVDKRGSEIITTNGGQSWSLITGFNWYEPRGLKCLGQNVWILWDWSSKMYKTTNTGVNWTVTDFSGIGITVPSLYFLNSTTGYCSNMYNTRVYKTTDSGSNWIKICDGFGFEFYVWGNLYFLNEITGFACGNSNLGCIAKTTNGGYNWSITGIANGGMIFDINFLNSLTGYACGKNGLIWKTTNGGSVFVANISSEVPDKFELGQNYPNPFNQFSILNFKCKIKSMVLLNVFDMTGREVQTLVNETLAPGTYQVRFDGSGLASGLYYYQLAINKEQLAVKKMVMVK